MRSSLQPFLMRVSLASLQPPLRVPAPPGNTPRFGPIPSVSAQSVVAPLTVPASPLVAASLLPHLHHRRTRTPETHPSPPVAMTPPRRPPLLQPSPLPQRRLLVRSQPPKDHPPRCPPPRLHPQRRAPPHLHQPAPRCPLPRSNALLLPYLLNQMYQQLYIPIAT